MLVTYDITDIHLDKAEPATIPTCFGHGIIANPGLADHNVLDKDSVGDDVVPRGDCVIQGLLPTKTAVSDWSWGKSPQTCVIIQI